MPDPQSINDTDRVLAQIHGNTLASLETNRRMLENNLAAGTLVHAQNASNLLVQAAHQIVTENPTTPA